MVYLWPEQPVAAGHQSAEDGWCNVFCFFFFSLDFIYLAVAVLGIILHLSSILLLLPGAEHGLLYVAVNYVNEILRIETLTCPVESPLLRQKLQNFVFLLWLLTGLRAKCCFVTLISQYFWLLSLVFKWIDDCRYLSTAPAAFSGHGPTMVPGGRPSWLWGEKGLWPLFGGHVSRLWVANVHQSACSAIRGPNVSEVQFWSVFDLVRQSRKAC